LNARTGFKSLQLVKVE